MTLILFASVSTAAMTCPDRSGFPAHWWQSYPKESAASWEILPHEAGRCEVILSKRNELGLLSNFAATPFTYRGKRYASIEGFWQMMLYPEGPQDPRLTTDPSVSWPHTRDEVAQMTAFKAKKAGDEAEAILKKLRIDWVSFEGKRFPYRQANAGEHYRLIREAMREKLAQNPEVKKTLLATGDLILKPDHHQEAGAPPEWRYFEIYMKFRHELRSNGMAQRVR